MGLTDDHRRCIDDLIAHFVPREVLARVAKPNAR
jgi:hypothetical protein